MATLVARLIFRSSFGLAVYRKAVLSPHRWARMPGHCLLALAYLVRTAPQFTGSRVHLAAVSAFLAAEAAALLVPQLLPLLTAAVATALALTVGSPPADETGHRAGAEGFTGQQCENTVEALASLAQRDQEQGPLPHLPYIEFDVQETADGQLVVFHDALLSRAFPAEGINSKAVAQLEKQIGCPFHLLTVQDLTLAQLHKLHIAGRQGLRVPTLQQFLEACIAAGVRRSLAVEVKVLLTDAARQEFIDAISGYREQCALRLAADPAAARHRHLGWAGVIAFPHHFAQSFGEYGTPQWRRWAAAFKERGIPVRACHATWLTLIY